MRYERLSIILAVLFLAGVLVACGQKAAPEDGANAQPAEDAAQIAGPSDAEIEQVETDLNDIAAIESEIDDSDLEGIDEDLAQI